MNIDLPSRRDVLKLAATTAATTLIPASSLAAEPTTAPATKPTPPLIGIQIGAKPLATMDLDKLLDQLRDAGINTLFVFAYGHTARWVPMEQKNFRGGNFAIPHMQYYKDTTLTYDDMRAPEFKDADILERTMKATRKHGFKTYALIQEADKEAPVAHWETFYEIDSRGRRQKSHPGGPCSNNPQYRAFTQGLMEDYLRSYEVDGFMWSSERQGGMLATMGLWHHGNKSDPSRGTCFCDFCLAKAKTLGINADRAREAFLKLEQFTRDSRANKRPRDGYFVTFMRLLFAYPELLQWETLWINSRFQFMTDARNKVKSINPATPLGFHVWHNASFSPFYRAETNFAEMAKNADFLKPVLYNTCAGERMKSFVDSIGQTIFGDIPRADILQMLYHMFDYKEAPYDQVAKAGFSTDYIANDIKRTLDDTAGSGCPIYAGIDIDIPDSGSTYTPDTIQQSVKAALTAGATGLIIARNYAEMNPTHLAAVGTALKGLGML